MFMAEQQTFASTIPECKECGSTDVAIIADFTSDEKPHLRCGHKPNFVLKWNPAVFPDEAA